MMRITLLGTGTSTGIPVPGCSCRVCSSPNPKDERLRASVLIEISEQSASEVYRILIDTAPDLRQQALRYGVSSLDAVLYTHTHADHIFGLDDLRCFNFSHGRPIQVFASESSADELERVFRYAFYPDPNYAGGAPPRLVMNRISNTLFPLFSIQVQPLPILHGQQAIHGFRLGKFAYLTDCSHIPEATYPLLENLEVLIIDGLRHRPHATHFTQEQAVREVEKIRPRKAYLTHMSHEVLHDEGNTFVASLTSAQVSLAYDGLVIELG